MYAFYLRQRSCTAGLVVARFFIQFDGVYPSNNEHAQVVEVTLLTTNDVGVSFLTANMITSQMIISFEVIIIVIS